MPFGTSIEYKNVELRSLHEFAWARFWTRAGLQWSYEPTKFYAGRASYTPDFLIKGIYIEIKAAGGRKLNNFDLCIEPLILIFGKPDRHHLNFKPAHSTRFEPSHTTWTRIYQRLFV